jgi:DNA-binding transcriptional MerR regulator
MMYVKKDIARIIDEPTRKITFWTDSKLVKPDIESEGGRGVSKKYSELNLIEFAMIKVMRDHLQISLHTIQMILAGLRAAQTSNRSFTVFYDNPAWGLERELLFIQQGQFGPKGFYPIEKDEHGSYVAPPIAFDNAIKNATLFTTIMLGKIKNLATKIAVSKT